VHSRHPLGPGRILISTLLATGAFVTPAALAAPAAAATLAVTKPCYVDTVSNGVLVGAPMDIVGTGFAPGDAVRITSSDSTVDVQTTADGAGNINVVTRAPIPFFSRPEAKVQTLNATDSTAAGATISASASVRDTELAVATAPAHARPSRKVIWYFSGFISGRYVYGHYVRSHRQVARARFGRAKGLCGLLRVRAHFFPGHQRFRHYGLQFDDSRHYSRHSTPRIVTTLDTSIF
jgi:hypothetical protein